MKSIVNKVETVRGVHQYTVNGQGSKRHSDADVKMTDGKVTRVNRDVNKGALVDGSNSPKKNRVTVASVMIKGADLDEAVIACYAVHGYRVIEGQRVVTGRDNGFRISPKDPNVVQTYNFTVPESDPRHQWRDAFRIDGAVANMETHAKAKAKAPRADAGKTHQTQGVEYNRNRSLIQQRNEGALKVRK